MENEQTPEQEAAALLLAARASNFAINNAKTKFTPEQQKKIYAEALQRFREKAMDSQTETHSPDE